MPTYRLLFDSDDSASIVAADQSRPATNEKTVIAGNRYRLLAKNAKLPANSDLDEQQQDRRHPGDEQQERHQDRQLAEDVLGRVSGFER